MDDFNSETDSDYTSYWRDWVRATFSLYFVRRAGLLHRKGLHNMRRDRGKGKGGRRAGYRDGGPPMRFCVQPFDHMTPRLRPGNPNSFQHLSTYTKRGDTPEVYRSRYGFLFFIIVRTRPGVGVDPYDF
jgi:hypothetical protein